MKKLFLIFLIFVSSFSNAQNYGDSLLKKDFVSAETVEYWMVRYINEERIKLGLDTLTVNTEIDQIAKKHSAWMLRTGKYQHSEARIAEVITQGGFGSNRYSHKLIARSAINAWMDSPGHKYLLMSSNYKHVGVGFAYLVRQSDGYITVYYTATLKQ